MKILSAKNYEEAGKAAAGIIASQIRSKPGCVIGFSTGSSPLSTYGELIRLYESGALDFSEVRSVNLDEYVGLDGSNDKSYAYYMRKNLFDHVNINPANINLLNGVCLDANEECERYERVLNSLGGVDLQLLGLGLNGHIGFNEPSDSFSDNVHRVELSTQTIQANKRFFEREEDVPRFAYTMGISDIMRARRILLIVNGENKADILRSVCLEEVTPRIPGTILRTHPDVTVVADEAAVSKLPHGIAEMI